jgi:NDP-sugar pyrophosphorylase family protein
LKGSIEAEYVFQEMDKYMDGHTVPSERIKPWGTSHAILCAKEVVNEPFAVINADDFYGADAFRKAVNFLTNDCKPDVYAIIGYQLANTLSEHGTVSRGVCGVMVDQESEDRKVQLPEDVKASMNFWCFHPSVFDFIQKGFKVFLDENINNPKSEYLIPFTADQWVKAGNGVIKVIPTSAKWFGVTYKEDAPVVQNSLNELVQQNEYPDNLWK